MKIYKFLSSINWLSSNYSLKFLFIAFLGIHIPLIGIIIYLAFFAVNLSPFQVIIVTLLLTLVATAITLYFLNDLLFPLKLSKSALEKYLNEKKLPDLPVNFEDEAGILLKDIQVSITSIESFLEAKRDIASLISHDVRSPIAQINHIIQLIRQDSNSSHLNSHLDQIESLTIKELEVLDHLIYLLRAEEGVLVTSKGSKFPVVEIVEEVLLDLKQSLVQKKLDLKLDVDSSIQIFGDKLMLSKLLHNLLSNAIKFSHQNGVIHFSIRNNDGNLIVKVKDNGIGFNTEIAKNLFQKFTLSGRKGTHGEKTTGLGLYLSQKIARNHNGMIKAESPGEGLGATFTAIIPLSWNPNKQRILS